MHKIYLRYKVSYLTNMLKKKLSENFNFIARVLKLNSGLPKIKLVHIECVCDSIESFLLVKTDIVA